MSVTEQWQYDELRQPLSSDAPCGEDLEDSQLLAAFDAFRLFGQSVPLNPAPVWRDVETKSRAALEQSKDLRLLAHLAAAVLRTEGLPAFLGTLGVAAHWLEQYWTQVYPRVDDDAILRKNALNSFADRMAIVDGVRREPVVRHPLLGAFSLRDHEISTGLLPLPEGEEAPDAEQIRGALSASPVEDLAALHAAVNSGLDALKLIESKMREEGGSQAAPTFDPLVSLLSELQRLLAQALAGRTSDAGAETTVTGDSGSASGIDVPGSGSLRTIRSREDAIRALDAVANYFRHNEPSSPIPLFIERSKRLVAKDFLEVLADIAPDALTQARAAGGMRDE
jgi:type VI secretion system protein ImpA